MKALLASLVLLLSWFVAIAGLWIFLMLGLVSIVEPPRPILPVKVIEFGALWLVSLLLFWFLNRTDIFGGRSLIERRRSELRHWLIEKRKRSRLVRGLFLIGILCLVLRIVMDFLQMAKR